MALKSSNKVDTNVYEIEVTVTPEVFTDACKSAYMKQRKSIQLPGFRKGKATQGMIEKVYGEGAFYEEALEIVYPEAVTAAIEEAGLRTVDTPFDLDVPVMSKEQGVEMKMKVTVYPEVKLGDYKGLKATMLPTEATDEDVDKEIENMRDRNSRLVTVEDREAQMGDTAEIDFEGFVDGVAFEGGKGENFDLKLGSGQFIPGFEDQLVGKSIGDEVDVNVTFPKEYHEEKLKGKPALFKVKINGIKVQELPELDDEFAKDVSEFDTFDEFKADLTKKLKESNKEKSKKELEEKILETICNNTEIDIPEEMFDNAVNGQLREFAMQLRYQGIDLEQYAKYTGVTVDGLKAQMRPEAEKSVKRSLVLEKIAKVENIQVSEEEIDDELAKIAENNKMDIEEVKKYVNRDDIKENKLVENTIKFVVDNAKVK